MRNRIIVILFFYILLIFGFFFYAQSLIPNAWESTDSKTDFIKLFGISATVLTSLVGTIIGILIAMYQSEQNRDLESMKARLDRLPTVFVVMREAAYSLYYAVQELQSGEMSENAISEAQNKMKAAQKSHAAELRGNEQKWHDFWTKANTILSEARLRKEGLSQEECKKVQKEIWDREKSDFTKKFRLLQEVLVADELYLGQN